ncbi:uncharacterized protein LOC144581690 [Callithrix jacchus]
MVSPRQQQQRGLGAVGAPAPSSARVGGDAGEGTPGGAGDYGNSLESEELEPEELLLGPEPKEEPPWSRAPLGAPGPGQGLGAPGSQEEEEPGLVEGFCSRRSPLRSQRLQSLGVTLSQACEVTEIRSIIFYTRDPRQMFAGMPASFTEEKLKTGSSREAYCVRCGPSAAEWDMAPHGDVSSEGAGSGKTSKKLGTLKARPSRVAISQEKAPATKTSRERTIRPDAYLQAFDHLVRGDLVGDLFYTRRVSDLPVGTHDATEGSGRLGLRGEVHPGGQLFVHSPLPASIGQKTKVQRERGDFLTSFFISNLSNLEKALSPRRPGTRQRPHHPLFPGARTPPAPAQPARGSLGFPVPAAAAAGDSEQRQEFTFPPFTMKSTPEHQGPKFGGLRRLIRTPRPPLGWREAPSPARLVLSRKADARPIGLGLGRKTRDRADPRAVAAPGNKTPLPSRASDSGQSPPRCRPSSVPLPHPRGRGKQAALHPQPHARKRLTRLRTSHFVPSTSAEGPQRLLWLPAAWRRRHRRGLPRTPGRPHRASDPRPPLCLSFRPLPPAAEGGSRAAAAAFTSSSCGRKVHRAPGPLSGGCAAAPRRVAHKAAPRVPPPPPARPGAALGLAVPRSSRRGGRRGASERWAGRQCRSPSGRGRAASEKAPPGACVRVSARDPRSPPARTSRRPG